MKNSGIKVVIRTLFFAFWIVAIISLLYVPSFISKLWPQKSITVFTWPLIMDSKVINDFEKETGIKVYISYYESNQELLTKLRATQGKEYDLITPSDQTVELLIKDNLIQTLDKSKLPFIQNLIPALQDNYYDPRNQYSVPYFWGVYGLGIHLDFFDGVLPENSWSLIFDEKKAPSSIAMSSDPREAIMLAAFYLFGSIEALKDKEKAQQVKELLIKQKQWVNVYTDARVEELLSAKSVALAASLSADIWKIIQNDQIEFMIPQEGSFLVIDCFAIPIKSEKQDLVYTLLNYLYKPAVLTHNMEKYGFCSPLSTVKDSADRPCPTKKQFEKLHFFKNIIPAEQLNEIWLEVMAA